MQPITWHSWNKESFAKAAKEKKPILLDIYGVWCHWCHVIEKTSYDDKEIIEIINKNFIPIKVDTDKRPDINKRYTQGGWPSTVFLTSTGQIITGTTYVPPDVMKDMMFRVLEAFKEIKNTEPKFDVKELEINDVNLGQGIIDKIMENMLDNFDFEYGGFGTAPKFPIPDAVELALNQYEKTKNKDFLIIASFTLDNMKGIFDKIEGGFYRYSVTQIWSEPHYEKMLETNSGAIKNYLQAYNITKKEEYKQIAEKSLIYIKNNLLNEEGAFYGSQDADEEYYNLDSEARKKHGKPFIDKNLYTDFSSMMISTYIYAYKILKNNVYKDFSIKSIKFLLKNNFDEKFGMYHYFDGKRKFLPGLLNDNIHFIKSLIDTFEVTNDKQFLHEAEKINDFVINNFMDKKDNCFYDKISNPEDIGFLKFRDKPLMENSITAINLLNLGKIKNNDKLTKMAENILKSFYSEYEKYSIHGAIYVLAVQEFLDRN